jgi:hypothetical protein
VRSQSTSAPPASAAFITHDAPEGKAAKARAQRQKAENDAHGPDKPKKNYMRARKGSVLANPFKKPVAYEPPSDPPWIDEDHSRDPQEFLFPNPSFVTDFCYHMKGRESVAPFNIFAALYAISVLSARQSWYKWADGRLWPNLFVLVVAEPSKCHKGAAFGEAAKLIRKLPELLEEVDDRILAEEKKIEEISSTATPEGVYMLLEKKEETFLIDSGGMATVKYGSRAFVWAAELVTLLNTKKYNAGLVERFTHLYDCPDKDRELTRMRGKTDYEDFWFCFAGACTPSGLTSQLPEEARTGGFLSRCVTLVQDFPTTFWDEPVYFECTPSMDDLLRRLGWLMYNIRGEYSMTPEAKAWYKRWYMDYKRAQAMEEHNDPTKARYEHLMIRIAMLLRMCEYREGHDVALENIHQAKKLLDYAYASSAGVSNQIGASATKQHYLMVRTYLRKHGSVERKRLLSRFASARVGIFAVELNQILVQLKQEGCISFVQANGIESSAIEPNVNPQERYVWKAEENLSEAA